MTDQHHGSPAPDRPPWLRRIARAEHERAASRRERSWAWRLLTPATFAAAGALLVASGINSDGTDLRAGRYDNLADLARTESERVQDLRAEVAALSAEVNELTQTVEANSELSDLQEQLSGLELAAGVAPMEGPGVTVVLDDAPREVLASAGEQGKEVVVHQQDIQAVANALWAGGAEAMMIQGQRIVSTTGIKCIGNTVRLQDVPYSPPYVISAVGDPAAMLSSIATNPYIASYRQAVEEFQLGWEVRTETALRAPEYAGPLELRYARPAAQS